MNWSDRRSVDGRPCARDRNEPRGDSLVEKNYTGRIASLAEGSALRSKAAFRAPIMTRLVADPNWVAIWQGLICCESASRLGSSYSGGGARARARPAGLRQQLLVYGGIVSVVAVPRVLRNVAIRHGSLFRSTHVP